ncbi:hypothetical protein Daesc_003260 [Daldinia eschscholtzii]|uniref:C2H2-type domain-containing protein n=1 Tax=Daldinia eschscholtzii TaxID=292717 RepID=A0AAX6MSK3_9PEZI
MSDYLNKFDFEVLSDNEEYAFNFDDLDNIPPIGQEHQEPAFDVDFALLPDATAAPVEPSIRFMNAEPRLKSSFGQLDPPTASGADLTSREPDRAVKFYRSDQEEQSPFKKISDYKKHLKEAHGEAVFHCRVAGCDRKGSKGYLRESDFRKHLAKQHPDAPKYSPAPRKEERYNCPHCENSFTSLQDLSWHFCKPSTGFSSV